MLFVVSDPHYNVGMDVIDDHAGYIIIGPKDVNRTTGALGDILKQGAHARLFWSALKLALIYKVFPSRKRE